jgi:hypothetical protein
MRVFERKGSDLERVEWNNDLSEVYAQKIPCESNCPYLVITDTLNCQKEFEGLVDMEEVRGGTSDCPFWPHKDLETKGKGKSIRSSWANALR